MQYLHGKEMRGAASQYMGAPPSQNFLCPHGPTAPASKSFTKIFSMPLVTPALPLIGVIMYKFILLFHSMIFFSDIMLYPRIKC